MNIQSLSVVVPSTKCINDCAFCVSKMHKEEYKNQLDSNKPFYDLYQKDYLKRLEFARDNGCNTVMLTGNGEPQQNRPFLEKFGLLNEQLDKPFRWIEIQTTGVLLDDGYLRFLRNHVGVSTISISLSSFDSEENAKICGMKAPVDIDWLCAEIKRYDFNLRLSINLNKSFNNFTVDEIFEKCKNLGADQITFRVLYTDNDCPQKRWIEENMIDKQLFINIQNYVETKGRKLEKLPYGARKYSVNEMSVVVDYDCMATDEDNSNYKYLILRPDCKLYSKWDDKASLIF